MPKQRVFLRPQWLALAVDAVHVTTPQTQVDVRVLLFDVERQLLVERHIL